MIEIGTRVIIKELDKLQGTVKSIWITEKGTQYLVRYFSNSKAEEVYFYEDELKEAT